MHLTLSASGVGTGIKLFSVSVDEAGHWTYESRAVERAEGKLSPGDREQLQDFYLRVDWGKETLNNPVSIDDRTLFKLEVDHGNGDRRLYQFSEAMNHLSWQFRDLVHFLRHNVITGEPLGQFPDDTHHQPPAIQ